MFFHIFSLLICVVILLCSHAVAPPSSQPTGQPTGQPSHNNPWKQRGADIDGEARYDESGKSVSLSGDGNRVAIGAPNHDGNNTYSVGHVRVYEWDNESKEWKQLGADIDGESQYDNSGNSVSLSGDGNRVAIGAPRDDGNSIDMWHNSGHVRVYEWDNESEEWKQLGFDIDGESQYDIGVMIDAPFRVSLSFDGSRIAIGAPGDDGDSTSMWHNSGHVRVYEWEGATNSVDMNNHKCYPGQVELPHGECFICFPGTKPSKDRTRCVSCEAGTYSPGFQEECKPCESGSYAFSGSRECKMCPAGTYSPAKSSRCYPCELGKTSHPGSSSCDFCSGSEMT